MKKQILISLLSLCILFVAVSCSASPQNAQTPAATPSAVTFVTPSSVPDAEPVEIYVSAAASLTDPLTRIARLFEEENVSVKVNLNFGASGTLQTQIEEGAPADVFLSAAEKQMNILEEKNLILPKTRKDILTNTVVLIVSSDSSLSLTGFEDCLTDTVTMIAIGDPESVPAGQYAKEIFTNLGGWDIISAKANFASNVKEVLAWTETGNVDCGIVYKTDAVANDKVKIIIEAPEGRHQPVVFPAALTAAAKNPEEAKAFLDFLSTDAAKAVFIEAGFNIAD